MTRAQQLHAAVNVVSLVTNGEPYVAPADDRPTPGQLRHWAGGYLVAVEYRVTTWNDDGTVTYRREGVDYRAA